MVLVVLHLIESSRLEMSSIVSAFAVVLILPRPCVRAGLKSDAPTSFRDGVDQQISADQQGLMAKILKSLVGLVLGGYPKTPPVLGPFQTIGIEELAIGTENRWVGGLAAIGSNMEIGESGSCETTIKESLVLCE